MECCLTAACKEARKQKRVNHEIDQLIQQDRKSMRRQIRLVLAGTERSGKSTFIRELRMAHVKHVYRSICESMAALIQAMDTLGIPYGQASNEEISREFRQRYGAMSTLDEFENCMEASKKLWADPGIQMCRVKERESKYSNDYYLTIIDTLDLTDCRKTFEDILRAPTTQLTEYYLDIDRVMFKIVDVTKVRSERKKWMHYFDNMDAVMFIFSLIEYDDKDRMERSKALFRSYLSYTWFRRSPFILHLNKTDLLEEKIMTCDVVDYFPEFDGPTKNPQSAREFILKLFIEVNTDPDRIIYSHFTCATDSENIWFVFSAVKDTILQYSLRVYNLL